jgi:hypothetical protein
LPTLITTARRVLLNVATALLTGYLLCYYSEWMFWAGQARSVDLLDYLFTWLAYSFLAYLFLLTVRYFRVHSLWAVFLAGAVYGWLGEGVLVQTMYDTFPLNISWTGLAWHALISVLGGWYFMRLSTKSALLTSILLGLFYGVWSSGWWIEAQTATPDAQFVYNMSLGIGLLVAYAGLNRLNEASFSPTKIGVACAGLLTLAYFAFVTIPTQPLALFILPPFMAFVLFTLNRNRRNTKVVKPAAKIPTARFLVVLVIPLTASLIYALLYGTNIETLTLLYVVMMPLGFLLLFVSAFKLWRADSPST